MHQCKKASVWLVRLQDDNLPLLTRAQLRFHLLLCDKCREFRRQLSILQRGVKAWREQTD